MATFPDSCSIGCEQCDNEYIQDYWDRAIARAEEPDIDPEEEPTC